MYYEGTGGTRFKEERCSLTRITIKLVYTNLFSASFCSLECVSLQYVSLDVKSTDVIII